MARAPHNRGFTLVELLVVISIIATFAVAAGLSPGMRGAFGGAGANTSAKLVKALIVDFETARDTAILGRHRQAIRPVPAGWQILAFNRKGGRWTSLTGRNWGKLDIRWTINGRPYVPSRAPTAPPIQFLPDGRVTRFDMTVRRGKLAVTCHHKSTGVLECSGG